jgi:putative SOS response-associated peptidase YedK
MCGRYFLNSPLEAVAVQFACEVQARFEPSYNIAPTAWAPVVWLESGSRILALQRWGLVPSWSKDPSMGVRLANARAETVAEKPSFRGSFRHSRCVVPVDGFFEWQVGAGGAKQPFCIRAQDESLLGLAGLRARWEGPEGYLETFTIITTTANGVMAPIHDRMPVILGAEGCAAWLDPGTQPRDLKALLGPCPEAWLRAYPVSPKVGNVRNNGPELISPVS